MIPDIAINDVRVRMQSAVGEIPLEPVVQSMRIELSASAFTRFVEEGIRKFAGKLPLEVELSSANLVEGGAEIVAKVKRSILRADIKARIEISAPDGSSIRVRIAHIEAPTWVPTSMVIGQGISMASARPGLKRVADDPQAIDLDPAVVLASRGIPVKLESGGMWDVEPVAKSISVAFTSTT